MEAVAQAELFPVLEASEPRRSAYREYMDAYEEHGPLWPQSFVHVALEVSQQRVDQLISEGRIPRIQIRGKWFVPVISVETYKAEERKSGRPVRERTVREQYRKFRELYKSRKKS
jgi:hypothetical protein